MKLLQKPFTYRYYNASMYLIGINIIVFMITSFSRYTGGYFALIPGYIIQRYWIWQFVTYMFTHANISHILFNMLGLFFFGVQVEKRMGSSEFLFFYLFTGIAAGIFSFFAFVSTGAYWIPLLGASGAVYAVLLAFASFFPDARIYIFGILPIRAPVLVIGFTVIALASHFMNFRTGVAHLTHLAGFAFAYLYFIVRLKINPLQIFFGKHRRW